ncbi:hypothetical protein V8C34DRAFT_292167 [Trichoderma compactum]
MVCLAWALPPWRCLGADTDLSCILLCLRWWRYSPFLVGGGVGIYRRTRREQWQFPARLDSITRLLSCTIAFPDRSYP